MDPQRDDALLSPSIQTGPKQENKPVKFSWKSWKWVVVQRPLLGVVARLYDQKGVDLLINLLPRLMDESDAYLPYLEVETQVKNKLSEHYPPFPDRIGCLIGFDDS